MLINWNKFLCRLLKIQKKINQTRLKIRFCRNYQRLLIRSYSIKLLIIGEILFLKNHQNLIYSYIVDQQWRLALKSLTFKKFIILTDQNNNYIYNHINQILNKSINMNLSQNIVVLQFENFFSQKNKLWILSNILIEKKFFLSRINSFRNYNLQKKSLKEIIQNLCVMNNYQNILEYNNFIILSFKNSSQKFIINFFTRGLTIKYYKKYKSFNDFIKWFFTNQLVNIKIHQKQFYKYIKHKNEPLDQIIFELNKQIYSWSYFYNISPFSNFMNKYFFWRIWYWLKKRHRNKGSKWLYKKYWNKSTSQKWIFKSNNQYLIFKK